MLTVERPATRATAAPAPAALPPRDRRLIDAIVHGTPVPEGAPATPPDIVRMIPWIVPGLAVLTSGTILLVWAAVL